MLPEQAVRRREWLESEAANWRRRALDAEALLREVRPIIGSDELHDRVEAFLDARMVRDKP